MPRLLVGWLVRVILLLITPVFLFCFTFARLILWLDEWAADQLAIRDPAGSRAVAEHEKRFA